MRHRYKENKPKDKDASNSESKISYIFALPALATIATPRQMSLVIVGRCSLFREDEELNGKFRLSEARFLFGF
jgi:hypothetical protein